MGKGIVTLFLVLWELLPSGFEGAPPLPVSPDGAAPPVLGLVPPPELGDPGAEGIMKGDSPGSKGDTQDWTLNELRRATKSGTG